MLLIFDNEKGHVMRVGTIITEPTRYALELHDAKRHLRLDHGEDDVEILDIIKAAQGYLEGITELTFTTTSYRLTMDSWPASEWINLPHPPAISIDSVTYYDSSDDEQAFSATYYMLRLDGTYRSQMLLQRGLTWPSTHDRHDAVTIDYTAGFGSSAASCPATVRQAMRLLVAHWYEHREALATSGVPRTLQYSLRGLVARIKSGAFRGYTQ